MKTVLIVDDEPITRMDLADMLTELGFEVAGEAADGFDAIELCRALHPNVVLMDVRMPIFDGLTASETIISEKLADCVVLLTAFSDRDIIRRASRAGVSGYLVKPVDPKALLPAIEVALSQSGRLREALHEAAEAQKRLSQDKAIHKAQRLLAEREGCSEEEAYRRMRKTAMDKRITVAQLAESMLGASSGEEDVARVKNCLIKQRGMSENKAFGYISSYAKGKGLTVSQAARELGEKLFPEG